MKKLIILSIVLLLLGCSKNAADHDLVITNVTLIDGTGSPMLEGVTVSIDNGAIVEISNAGTHQTENVIDGTGKYLIPGLFDCHAHTSDYERDFPLFINFGITSILCPGGSKTTNEYFSEMRNLGGQDSLPAPRVFHTSQHFTMEGRHPVKTYSSSNWVEGKSVYYLRDTLQIEALVRQVSQYPIAGIKLTIEEGPAPPFVERIPQEFVNKVAKEARKNGTRVFAHVSDNTELSMALKAGITDILHYTGVDLDFERDKSLIDSIYQRDISWVTTMMIDKSFFYALYPAWVEQVERFNLFNPEEVALLRDSSSIQRAEQYLIMLEEFFGIENPNYENVFAPYLEEIKELNENGVNMVLGTDTGNTFIFPGYSLHEEMQIMEMGGIAAVEIIKMGTLNAAKMLEVEDSMGSIEVGKMADMILLDKNPLESIANTLAINTVIKNGRVQKRLVE